ncbi:MAG: hypothetical protein HRT45_04775 [Bdellovibrionales bacterium]|nr:hypothetical protein [Bdellovibrionales bacterium]
MTFRSDVANSEGRALLETADGVRVPLSSPTFVMTSGAAHRVEVKWRELCSVISEGSTCEGLSTTGQIKLLLELDGDVVDSQSFTVVVADPDPAKTGQLDTLDLCPDSDGTAASGGVCNFQVHGGHHFVRFSMFGVNGGFPNANLVPVDRVRVFMSEMSFTELVDPNSGLMPQDLKVRTEADGNITIDNLVHGLRPRTEYFFRLGVVDKAGNLSRVTSDQAIIDQCGALGFPTVECPFAAMTYAH